jgi:DnaK suppressor protein
MEGAAGIMSMKTRTTTTERRSHKLKRMLKDRGRELVLEVQGKIRDARNGNAKECDVLDEGESCEIDFQAEIGFALLQIKVETLNAIDAALRRLDEGTYGDCVECGDEIHEARLRALPFAVRCRECEETREMSTPRGRRPASRHGSSASLSELSN